MDPLYVFNNHFRMYGRSRSTIPSYRRGDRVPDPRINYNRLRNRRYMAPTASWMNRLYRTYDHNHGRRRRSPAGRRDRRILYGGNRRGTDRGDGSNSEDEEATSPPRPTVPTASEEELVNVLTVQNIQLNIEENVTNHHTQDYENTKQRHLGGKTHDPELVIRRGAEFEITIKFNRAYEKKNDDLTLIFKTGETPTPKSKTHASFQLKEDKDTSYKSDSWGAHIIKTTGNEMRLAVFVPPKCVIGEWELVVKTIVEDANGKKTSFRYEHPEDIYILLNPWCKEDAVYLSTEKLLDEYILNDGGAIFYGNYRQVESRTWNFGQFADGILDASLHLLRKAFGLKIDGNMGDPVYIGRALSRIVNSNDDNGVLVGNWSGKYKDGTRPTAWAGSITILEEYMKTGKPVKYGQCWVFSGILTSVCRAVGLPCRSVTNFASAHDTDVSCTIDKFYQIDEEGDLSELKQGGDSTWNFHVWNEVWMSRQDLPFGYDGWQVIDATPQELSDGVYCLGPSPVTAIKKGEINIGKDTPFVFAEVNADSIDWLVEDWDDFYVLAINKDKVGKKISTKKPTGFGYAGALSVYGDDNKDREDLTLSYKFAEGTAEERGAVSKVNKLSNSNKNPYVEDSSIKLELEEKDGVIVGEDFSYSVSVKNSSSKPRTIRVSMVVTTQSYDGETIDKVAHKHFEEQTLKGSEVENLKINVTADQYFEKTTDHFAMKVTAFCIISEEKRAHVVYDDFRLRRPELTLEAPSNCKLDDVLKVKVYFNNPLKVPLTKCKLMAEGSLILTADNDHNKHIIEYPDVPAKSKWETTILVKPKVRSWSRAERDLFLSFDCEEIPDIVGYHNLKLKK